MYVCMHVCMYVCMTYIHTCIQSTECTLCSVCMYVCIEKKKTHSVQSTKLIDYRIFLHSRDISFNLLIMFILGHQHLGVLL